MELLTDLSPAKLKDHYEWYVDDAEYNDEIPLSYDEYVRENKDNLILIFNGA